MESETQVFEFHYYFFPAVWNWPSSLSIFIVFLEEIDEEMSINRSLINHSCSINMTFLPLYYDLVSSTTISLPLQSPLHPANLHFLKHRKHSIKVYWMNKWMLKFGNRRQSYQIVSWKWFKTCKCTSIVFAWTVFSPFFFFPICWASFHLTKKCLYYN